MPAILSSDNRETWLTGALEEARSVLRQYPQECMVPHAVSTRVNSPRNNDPELIEAVGG